MSIETECPYAEIGTPQCVLAAQFTEAVQKLDEVLKEMERIGWPCRLVELPAHYIEVSNRLAEAERDAARLRLKLDYRNREPPHCPSCGCAGTPEAKDDG